METQIFPLSANVDLALSTISNAFITHFKTDPWGDSILIMGKTGKCFARIYWYHDNNSTVYLDWLSVSPDIRMQGAGTTLQEIREKIGKILGAQYSCLWVRKNTWMHKWYEKRGYKYFADYTHEKDAIWMKKPLS